MRDVGPGCPSSSWSAPDGVCEPEVGVADHAEDVGHAPVATMSLDHRVGDRLLVLRLLFDGRRRCRRHEPRPVEYAGNPTVVEARPVTLAGEGISSPTRATGSAGDRSRSSLRPKGHPLVRAVDCRARRTDRREPGQADPLDCTALTVLTRPSGSSSSSATLYQVRWGWESSAWLMAGSPRNRWVGGPPAGQSCRGLGFGGVESQSRVAVSSWL